MHVGTGASQEPDFSVHLTQENSTMELKPIPITPALGEARQRPLSVGGIDERRRKSGTCVCRQLYRDQIVACALHLQRDFSARQ